jgi:predicted chitinase
LLESFPYTLRSAVWFWVANNCYAAADGGIEDTHIDAVTKIVNAGELVNHQKGAYKDRLNPVECRRKYTKLAYDAFK